MSTAQLVRPKSATEQFEANWVSIFPNEQVNAQQSVLFVKKLLAVTISNITYLRAIFPECAFGDRRLEDLDLKILRDDSKCPGACQVIKWVRGCFDALDKKYLKQLVLAIYTNPAKENVLIESYTFRFAYNEGATMNVFRNDKQIGSSVSTSETKKATTSLLRTLIILMQNLRPLPDDVLLTTKLFYYDDVTPSDYEPIGFRASKFTNYDYEIDPLNLKVGDVNTPFHSMNLRIKTDSTQFITTEGPDESNGIKMDKEEQTTIDVGKTNENTKQKNKRITRSNVAMEENKKFEIASNKTDDSVFKITEKTKKLAMKSKPLATKKANKEPEKKPVSLSPSTLLQPPSPLNQNRGTKRARAINNVVHEFEIETIEQSQEETLTATGGRRSKRRKSSIAEKPLLV